MRILKTSVTRQFAVLTFILTTCAIRNPSGMTYSHAALDLLLRKLSIILQAKLFLDRLHISIHILHVVILLKALNNLVDCSTLLLGNVFQVVRDTCKLATCKLKAFLLVCLLDCTE